jgi:AraC family transcriptional regulator
MDSPLIDHGRTKFPRARLIETSAGRNWSGIHAERRSHVAGELPAHLAEVTEITYALCAVPRGKVLRTGAGCVQSTAVNQGTLWITPQGVLETATRITEALPDILHVCLPRGLFTSLSEGEFPHLRPEALRYEAGVDDPLIAHMMSSIATELHQETAGGNLLIETAALALGARLGLKYAANHTRSGNLFWNNHALDARRLRRVLEFINQHLEQSISVQDLAHVASLSPFHFSRAFKKATGLSPHRFVSERRLERAKTLLSEGRHSITEVAMAAHFSSQASFTKAFTSRVGMPPGAYRATGKAWDS